MSDKEAAILANSLQEMDEADFEELLEFLSHDGKSAADDPEGNSKGHSQ